MILICFVMSNGAVDVIILDACALASAVHYADTSVDDTANSIVDAVSIAIAR